MDEVVDVISNSWRWAPVIRADRIWANTLVVETERKEMNKKVMHSEQ